MNVVAFTVVAVTTPAMLTLSKLVCPSTSKSFTMLTTPLIVVIPATIPVSCDPSPLNEDAVTIPVALTCFVKKVVPVTVDIPATVKVPPTGVVPSTVST